jgi:adenylosuccinate lyase
MREDLDSNVAVLGEAYQTVLRREGVADAYERVKAATRGREVDRADLDAVLADADVDERTRERLRELTPADYVGLAADLTGVDDLDGVDGLGSDDGSADD